MFRRELNRFLDTAIPIPPVVTPAPAQTLLSPFRGTTTEAIDRRSTNDESDVQAKINAALAAAVAAALAKLAPVQEPLVSQPASSVADTKVVET